MASASNFFGEESLYVTITETGTVVRPLMDKPITVWQHSVPKAAKPDRHGKPEDIRRYKSYACTRRSGGECLLCQTQDPLWSILSRDDQYDNQNRRADFPVRARYFIPVWDQAAGAVKIAAGSKGMFKDMAEYASVGGNITECDWILKKVPVNTRYKHEYKSVRQDKSQFTVTPEISKATEDMIKKIHSEVAPPDATFLLKYISGESAGDMAALPASSGTGSFGALPPPPPPPPGATPDNPAEVLQVPIMTSPDGAYVLTSANSWVLVSDAKAKNFKNAGLI